MVKNNKVPTLQELFFTAQDKEIEWSIIIPIDEIISMTNEIKYLIELNTEKTNNEEKKKEIEEYILQRKKEIWEKQQEWIKLEKEHKKEIESFFNEQKKTVELSKAKTNISIFKHAFSFWSVDNEIVAEAMLFSLLGTIAKKEKIKIKIKDNDEYPILHLFWIQDSATGKDKAMDFLLEIIKRYNQEIEKHEETKDLKPIKVFELSGTETLESFLDSYATDNTGRPILTEKIKRDDGTIEIVDAKPTPGIFSSHDLIISRECSFLFKERSYFGKQTKSEVFLQVLEGRPVVKTLSSWRTKNKQYDTKTYFDGTFIGITRPFDKMKSHIAYSGLQQRAINITRRISIEQRNDMMNKISQLTNLNQQTIELKKIRIKQIIDMLMKFSLLMKKRIPYISEKDDIKIKKILRKFNDGKIKFIYDTYNDVTEMRNILLSFIGRFSRHIDIIAFFHALLRVSKTVDALDYEYAIEFIDKTFSLLVEWLDSSIDLDERLILNEKKQKRIVYETLKSLLEEEEYKKLGGVPGNVLIGQCVIKLNKSVFTVKNIVRDLIKKKIIKRRGKADVNKGQRGFQYLYSLS